MNVCKRFCSLALLVCLSLPAFGHSSSQAYLDLRAQGPATTTLRVDLALRDLDAALDLDRDADGQLTWGEVQAARSAIDAYALGGLALAGCAAGFSVQDFGLERRADGVYAALHLQAPCALGLGAALRYTLLGEVDPMHRALLKTTRAQQASEVSLLHPLQPSHWMEPAAPASAQPVRAEPLTPVQALGSPNPPRPPSPPSFWLEGMHHLITGYDHLLFLLCLLLPALLMRQQGQWVPVARPRQALAPVAGIVTAFTLAHSLTLGLAALGHLHLPPSLIEPLIAASIVLAALDNLKRVLPGPRWAIALGFGLIHGFGFAGVLGELGLPAGAMAWALLQFNLGLELAQLGVVVVALALLWPLRRWRGFRPWVLGAGSGLAALMGAVWVVQRTA